MEGKEVHFANRITALPPTGMAIEVLAGPLAGSKFFNYYTPKGDQTEVTIVGEFIAPGLPEDQLRGRVTGFLETAFNDDNSAIKSMAAHHHGSGHS